MAVACVAVPCSVVGAHGAVTWAELSGEKDFSSNRGLICITVAHGCEEVGTTAFDLVSQLFLS